MQSEEELVAVPLEVGWSWIRTAIGNAAKAALGTEAPTGRNDWYDGEYQQMSTEKKAATPLVNRFVRSYQAGFTDGRSTTDQIFTVRQILQKCLV